MADLKKELISLIKSLEGPSLPEISAELQKPSVIIGDTEKNKALILGFLYGLCSSRYIAPTEANDEKLVSFAEKIQSPFIKPSGKFGKK